MQVSYAYETLTCLGLFLAKTATLLLFHQLFQVSRQTRMAIQAGIIVSALLYGASIAAFSYHSVPHVGKTWDDIVITSMLHPSRSLFAVKWGIGQATLGAALDIYIFILPLPTILRLHLPSRKRIQLMAVFSTAILGIVASLVCLVYRVESLSDTDSTWLMGVLMICNQVELAVAIIVSSMPGFVSFVRMNVFESKLVSSLRSLLGSTRRNDSRGTIPRSPNANLHQLQPGSDPGEHEKTSVYYELSEPRPVDVPFIVDVEPQLDPLQPSDKDNVVNSQSSIDVQHPTAAILANEGMPRRWMTVSTWRLSIDSLYQREET
ncbi:hypothetical protein FJTKL_04154 [Diaporthe vaccinii]|uniref:Rhodopsin domain-containing protein n=1 Tax=Diaporthe vaccinii TaxID=105482 RepID=A0ABR4DTK8_9PEZI